MMQWDFVVEYKEHNYEEVYNHYNETSLSVISKENKFYCLWMAARARKFIVGVSAYTDYAEYYMEIISEYPDYVEPMYELCETAPSVITRYTLYKKCLQSLGLTHSHSDPEIKEWKALAGFLVESYNLEKYSDAYDVWVELQNTCILDKVDVKYKNWVDHVKKCGIDATNKLLRISSFAKFCYELSELKKGTNVFDIHFVWVQGHRTYSIIQYLAVRAARANIYTTANIYIYNDIEPKDNEYWELTKKYATIVHITPPRYINGKDVPYAQHVADIMRVCIIYRFGGIYLDFDLLLIKNISQLLEKFNCDKHVIMCKETDNKIWNGFIAAKPYNVFLSKWLREYESKYGDESGGCWWAGLSVETPMRLYKADNTDVTLLDRDTFLPFGFYDDAIYQVNYTGNEYSTSYGVHLWETEAEKRGVLPKNREWFDQHPDTIFAKLFSKYMDEVSQLKETNVSRT
jgi:hypothetical protein